MQLPICQTVWCNFRIVSLPVDYLLHVFPEPGFPYGLKGREFSGLWRGLPAARPPGLLLLDPDIAADPDDLAAMTAAAAAAPQLLHTAAVKLWPQSTGLDDWIWSHRGGTFDQPAATQQEDVPIAYVATGMLYAPARLLDLVAEAGPRWNVYQWDVGVSELALAHGIEARLVPGCRPKHLHFTPEHEVRPYQRKETHAAHPRIDPDPPPV